ncbi:MAG: MarR family winged helix-turn-helix transcriptional regulator [Ilumatobacteraceae bacterium]
MIPSDELPPDSPDRITPDVPERLRHSVTRLARLLRQQDESGLSATLISTLASIRTVGPLTLGELATREQVTPPSMTKIVEKLETLGFVTRATDPNDRRVSRVSITTAGKRHLDTTRARRTAWLAARLERLDDVQLARITNAIDALETLIACDQSPESTR